MRKIFGWGSVIIVLILALLFWWLYYYTYSTGNRTGLLQKFSYKGNIFKTYEGDIILFNIQGGGGTSLSSEKFSFSVTSERVAKQLDNLQGKTITVHYHEKNNKLAWRGDSKYIVDSAWLETR